MKDLASAGVSGVIDAAAHPVVPYGEDLRKYMAEPWSHAYIPPLDRFEFIPPNGGYLEDLVSDPASLGQTFYDPTSETFRVLGGTSQPSDSRPVAPGSDPDVADAYLRERGIDIAVLLPRARGLVNDPGVSNAVCSALNLWLAETWLGEWNSDARYRGSIRVDPRDPDTAISEIEKWADHPYMVQVVVPFESLTPYGERQFEGIWRAAADHQLPVAIMGDGDFNMTGIQEYSELSLLGPWNYYQHLMSFLANGVLDRVEGLQLVFVDGGSDLLMPLFWRADKDWLGQLVETPWVRQRPTDYFAGRVFFCQHALETGPRDDPSALEAWVEISGIGDSLLYSSRFPHWHYLDPTSAAAALPSSIRKRVMHGNADTLYRLS
jgi:predicted TIM-barrel fold metal-dependent hydrolase